MTGRQEVHAGSRQPSAEKRKKRRRVHWFALALLALKAAPVWADHATPLRTIPMSPVTVGVILAALLAVMIVICIAIVRAFRASRESEPE